MCSHDVVPPFHLHELKQALKNLRHGKTADCDGLVLEMFSIATDNLLTCLLGLYNKVLSTGYVEQSWKNTVLPCCLRRATSLWYRTGVRLRSSKLRTKLFSSYKPRVYLDPPGCKVGPTPAAHSKTRQRKEVTPGGVKSAQQQRNPRRTWLLRAFAPFYKNGTGALHSGLRSLKTAFVSGCELRNCRGTWFFGWFYSHSCMILARAEQLWSEDFPPFAPAEQLRMQREGNPLFWGGAYLGPCERVARPCARPARWSAKYKLEHASGSLKVGRSPHADSFDVWNAYAIIGKTGHGSRVELLKHGFNCNGLDREIGM